MTATCHQERCLYYSQRQIFDEYIEKTIINV